MTEIDDYAEPLLQLQSLTKALERALLHKDNKEAFKLSTDAVNVSIRLQNWTFRNME
jgi:hypothetical protein